MPTQGSLGKCRGALGRKVRCSLCGQGESVSIIVFAKRKWVREDEGSLEVEQVYSLHLQLCICVYKSRYLILPPVEHHATYNRLPEHCHLCF